MMSALVRELPWALERVGALLEQDVAADGDWKIGAVERESGVIEAHLLVGLGRSPAKLRFSLQASDLEMSKTPGSGQRTRLPFVSGFVLDQPECAKRFFAIGDWPSRGSVVA